MSLKSTQRHNFQNGKLQQPGIFMRNSTKTYFITAFLSLALSCGIYLTLIKIESETRKQINNTLSNVLEASHSALIAWYQDRKNDVGILSHSAELKALTLRLLDTDKNQHSLLQSPAQKEMRDYLAPVISNKQYQGFFIIDPNLVNLASSRDANVGTKNLLSQQPSFFDDVWSGRIATSLPQASDVPLRNLDGVLVDGRPTMFVGAPIMNTQNKVVAVLALRIDPSLEFTRILQRGRTGLTGETYAFDAQGRLISESRFDNQLKAIGLISENQQAILNIQVRDPGVNLIEGNVQRASDETLPLTRMAMSAIAGENGSDLDGYRDYRGVSVIGTWNWIDAYGIGITTEQDFEEAYGVLSNTKTAAYAFGAFSVFTMFLSGLYFRSTHRQLEDSERALRENQSALIESGKMASLGGLVAGVAHEINTPLGAGLTAATYLQDQAKELAQKFEVGQMRKSDFQAFLDDATKSTWLVEANLLRASDLIQSFKKVAVDQSSEERRTINVLNYVEEVLQSLRPIFKHSKHQIELTGDDTLEIETFPGALSQVVTNLVMNAISHAYDVDEEGHIQIAAKGIDENVLLECSDDGKGMDENVKAKIFDPFFTTKRGSGGSGLGLHILYNLVTNTLGGNVSVFSTPGLGTKFKITIPAVTSTS